MAMAEENAFVDTTAGTCATLEATRPGVSFYVRPGSQKLSAVGEASKYKLPPSPPLTPTTKSVRASLRLSSTDDENKELDDPCPDSASGAASASATGSSTTLVRSVSDSALAERVGNYILTRDSGSAFTPLSASTQARTPNLDRLSKLPEELMPSFVTPAGSSMRLGEVVYEPALELQPNVEAVSRRRRGGGSGSARQPRTAKCVSGNLITSIKCCFKLGTGSASEGDLEQTESHSVRLQSRTLWSLRFVRYEKVRRRRRSAAQDTSSPASLPAQAEFLPFARTSGLQHSQVIGGGADIMPSHAAAPGAGGR